MIPVSSIDCQDQTRDEEDWQSILQHAIRDPAVLCRELGLSAEASEAVFAAAGSFPLRVPRPYLKRIRPGDPADPLLLQVLPQAAELQEHPGFCSDPLEEKEHNPVPGVVHKYASRLLLVTTSLCAIHCRYCFRRDFPYEQNRNSRQEWQGALDYISSRPEVNEVILSGGDPLALPDRQLAWLTRSLAAIPHVRRLRIHTRLPIVIPERITDECLDWMTGAGLPLILVTHCNHPQELDNATRKALGRLRSAGLTLLNQSVLLAQVNDCADTLAGLSEALFESGCLPYYLHALDPVRGSHHFAVPDQHAIALHRALQARLPGFLVPRLVRETPGRPSKSWLV